jgi:hypothetical protein
MVTMTADPGGSTDGWLARAALPTLDDISGRGWFVDDSADDGPSGDDGPAGALLDGCLPDGFPDGKRSAEAEIAFVRPGTSLIVALASVFTGPTDAAEAWTALMDDEFGRRFAEAIAAEVTAANDELSPDGRSRPLELLGPVVGPSAFTVERRGVRTAQQRAVFAGATDNAVTPVVLHGAVTAVGRTVVLVWAVDAGEPDDDVAWAQLVIRVEGRAASANLLDR